MRTHTKLLLGPQERRPNLSKFWVRPWFSRSVSSKSPNKPVKIGNSRENRVFRLCFLLDVQEFSEIVITPNQQSLTID